MNELEKKLKEKIEFAISIVDKIDNQYKLEAFKVVLSYLLQNTRHLPKIINEIQQETPLTLSELIAGIRPGTYSDTALIISYYLFKFENITNFNVDHIKDRFNKTRAVKPKNMSDTLNNLIRRGLLRSSSEIDNKKGFEITKTGILNAEELIKKKGQL